MNKIYKKEEALLKEQKYFTDIISHYLKIPIISQIKALEILNYEKLGKINFEQKKIISEVINSNYYIIHILDNILLKYKIEKRVLLSKTNCDIRLILNKVLDNLKYMILEKNQTFNVKCGIFPLNTEFDEKEIEFVLFNLILNSIEHSFKNSQINVTILNKKDYLEVEIQDFGTGFERKTAKIAFENKINKKNKYRKIGSGLGLYLSKKIISAHNGNIFIKKTGKFGTCIVFTIPFNT